MPQERLSRLIFTGLITLLLGVMGFVGKAVYSHEQRISTIEERVPVDLKERLTRIEDGISRISTDGTTH